VTIEFDVVDSTRIKDVKIITPSLREESRGSIWTSYTSSQLSELLPNGKQFKHDKFSISKKNVLRGIHGDYKSWKLVSCVSGSIFQIVVDMRETSETFLQWQSFDLGDNNRQMILIPPCLGNGFYVKSDRATYHYKLAYDGDYADVDEQFTVGWNDSRINILWPSTDPILSERDMRLSNAKN
jgi:dTDP-4-dehydrorhamnose 3,5-epimerase